MNLTENQSAVDHKVLLEQLLHEIRSISHVIKSSSEILSKSTAGKKIDKQAVEHHSQLIFENAYLLSLWLDIGDFELHPELFAEQEMHPRSIWGKFKKSVMSFRRVAKNRQINFELDGKSEALIDCYPIIDILPYIILDNAVKYSPSHSTIEISFKEDISSVSFAVSSMGPISNACEDSKLFDYRFRSQAAIDSAIPGYGRGLALAKIICDLHSASINIERGADAVMYNDNEYSSFIIQAKFLRHA